jgi:hypothetical protein
MEGTTQKVSTRSIATSLFPNLPTNEKGQVEINRFLLWPPDLFALTSRILKATDAYTNVIAPCNSRRWPPEINNGNSHAKNWPNLVRETGLEWRMNLEEKIPNELGFNSFNDYTETLAFGAYNNEKLKEKISKISELNALPKYLSYYWGIFTDTLSPQEEGNIDDFNCAFDSICSNAPGKCLPNPNVCDNCKKWESFISLISLHAIADEACAGWGIRSPNTLELPRINKRKKKKKGYAQKYVEELLSQHGTLSSIDISRCRILPKRHTPRVGITLRSLSANLAYHKSSVNVKWKVKFDRYNDLIDRFSRNDLVQNANVVDKGKFKNRSDKSLSILLFPWPLEISSTNFKALGNERIERDEYEFGFFSYQPKSDKQGEESEFEKKLENVISSARKETETIELVVLPECALVSDSELNTLEKVLTRNQIPSYITGVTSSNDEDFSTNVVCFNMAYGKGKTMSYKSDTRIQQNKHHRWKLDKSQIIKYNLGQVLTPNLNWWEGIDIKRRTVNFINIGEEITLCPLICEDLARQEPISDLIRAVGPSLVVTILMDGPQKRERWPARYANILSEDPGSTVITLTSRGMVDRCNQNVANGSCSIALISDGKGNVTEINIEKDHIGALVNLCLTPEKENLADGRAEYSYTNNLIVGAIHLLK